MQHEYQLLVREQHICGAQVHVDVPDRDVAVQVVRRVAPYLPTLLAISASSPYWRGNDTGYASYRSHDLVALADGGPARARRDGRRLRLAGRRPDRVRARSATPGWSTSTSGPAPTCRRSSCGSATPAPRSTTSCSIAGLFRALVGRAREDGDAGLPLPESRHELLRAASWRAARSGLEGDLVDLVGPSLVPPAVAVGRLVEHLRPQLEELGDWEQVLELSQATLARGSAAARAAPGVRPCAASSPTSSTACWPPPRAATLRYDPPVAVPAPSVLLAGYRPAAYDEAVSAGGTVRPHYGWMFRALDRMGPRGMAAAESALRSEQTRARRDVPGRRRRAGPALPAGPGSAHRHRRRLGRPRRRARTAGARAGGVRARRLRRARDRRRRGRPGLGGRPRSGPQPARHAGTAPTRSGSRWPASTWCATAADRWLVLEDNLRVPSGIGYSMMSRRLIRSVHARPGAAGRGGGSGDGAAGSCARRCSSATDPDEPGADEAALLIGGPRRLGVLRAPAAGRADGHPAGHAARAAGRPTTGVYLVGTGRPPPAVRALPAARRARPAQRPRRGPAPDRAGAVQRGRERARSRCSTRWATASPTTSSSTPTCRR